MFTSSIKREIRKFHVLVVQRQERNVQKIVMHVQLLFCRSKPIAFLPSRGRLARRRRCLKLPNSDFLYTYSQANQIGQFYCSYHETGKVIRTWSLEMLGIFNCKKAFVSQSLQGKFFWCKLQANEVL